MLETGASLSFRRILAIRPGVLALVNSAYRSNTKQAELRNAWEVFKAGGPWAAFAMLPGTSKHNAGLALDIDSNPWTADWQWMVDHGRDYGWIQTNDAEPWHFEYVAALDKHTGDRLAVPEIINQEDNMLVRVDGSGMWDVGAIAVTPVTAEAWQGLSAVGEPFKDATSAEFAKLRAHVARRAAAFAAAAPPSATATIDPDVLRAAIAKAIPAMEEFAKAVNDDAAKRLAQ